MIIKFPGPTPLRSRSPGTLECCYNMVQLITISESGLGWPQRNVNQTSISQQTPHTSPSRTSYGVSIVRILEKTDHVITAPHCILTHCYSVGFILAPSDGPGKLPWACPTPVRGVKQTTHWSYNLLRLRSIWVRSWNCSCLVTWFDIKFFCELTHMKL